MPKHLLLIVALVVILLAAYITWIVNSNVSTAIPKGEKETAINQAKHFYQQKRISGEDISDGPCLSNALIPNWVADIVHSPRTKIDDLPENQCPAYREGRAEHFVELDLEGNLVRTE